MYYCIASSLIMWEYGHDVALLMLFAVLPDDSECTTAERRPTPRPGSPQPDGVNDRFAVGEVGQAVTPCAEGFICQQVGLRESRCVRQDKMSKCLHR